MTFPMAKKYPPAYLHSPSQIQVQEASLKKKKEKGTLMTFLMVKKNTTQLTFIAQVSRKHPLKKKKEKGTLMTFPMAKKNTTPKLTFIAQAKIQVQKASPKEKKEKGTLITF